jgi:hypothetical protein
LKSPTTETATAGSATGSVKVTRTEPSRRGLDVLTMISPCQMLDHTFDFIMHSLGAIVTYFVRDPAGPAGKPFARSAPSPA